MALILSVRPGVDGPIHVLDRNTQEEMEIGVTIEQGQVKLSFTAAENITILRDKVYWNKENRK